MKFFYWMYSSRKALENLYVGKLLKMLGRCCGGRRCGGRCCGGGSGWDDGRDCGGGLKLGGALNGGGGVDGT